MSPTTPEGSSFVSNRMLLGSATSIPHQVNDALEEVKVSLVKYCEVISKDVYQQKFGLMNFCALSS